VWSPYFELPKRYSKGESSYRQLNLKRVGYTGLGFQRETWAEYINLLITAIK
jgi:hypothetical protein